MWFLNKLDIIKAYKMKKIIICFLASGLLICWYLLFLDPYKLTPIQFLPIIGTVYIFSALSIYILFRMFSTLGKKTQAIASAILAFSPTILCALMTLGKLSAIDVVLAILIPVFMSWYSVKIGHK